MVGLSLPDFIKLRIISRSKRYISKPFLQNNRKNLDQRFHRSFLQKALLEAVTYNPLPALLRYEDKNSMRWSIESRVPFVDPLIMEYCLSLPPDAKIKNGVSKVILRKAMESLLPSEINDRRDKIAFATPDKQIANSQVVTKTLEQIVNSDQFKSRPCWNWKVVEEGYLKRSRGQSAFVGEEIWRIIIVELWLRHWIDDDEKTIIQDRAAITVSAAQDA